MLKTRVLTSLVLVPSFFAALFLLPNTFWAILMLGISLIALYEWGEMAKFNTSYLIGYVLIAMALSGFSLYLAHLFDNHWLIYRALDLFFIAAIFWIFAVPFFLWKNIHIKNKWLLGMIGYLLVLPLWLALVCLKIADPWLLLGLMMTIWIADTAAYFTGKQFGKTKLAPSISPGKTWEGVLGGLLAVTIYSIGLSYYFALPLLVTLVILWAMSILSVIGDLFESLIKRQAKVKDSGSLLPGHGGVLDRIDGLTSSLPIAVFLIFIYSMLHAAYGLTLKC